jgi:hypothetical protein
MLGGREVVQKGDIVSLGGGVVDFGDPVVSEPHSSLVPRRHPLLVTLARHWLTRNEE